MLKKYFQTLIIERRLMNNKSERRWELAQEYEREWWVARAKNLDLEFYKRFAQNVEEIVKPYYKVLKDHFILEIGSGAAGIITYLDCENKYAIDPLEKIYSTIKEFNSIRDRRVIYKTAKAENIPYKNEMFDFIIMDNVLDHCENPQKVIFELKRVLKTEGIIYFRQNTYHAWGKIIRSLIEFLKIDKGHPFTFLKSDLRKLFELNKLNVLYYQESGYLKTWIREIKSNRLYDKIKAIIFATRDKTTFILQRSNYV